MAVAMSSRPMTRRDSTIRALAGLGNSAMACSGRFYLPVPFSFAIHFINIGIDV
jgi:hypothetical protein